MGDELIPGMDDGDEPISTEEAAPRPRWLSSSALVLAGGIFVGAVILVLVVVFLVDHSRDMRAETITNAPSASASAEDASSEPSETPRPTSPPVDDAEVSGALTECLGRATDYEHIREVADDCFLGYTKHLPKVYGLRDLGEISVDRVETKDADTAKITAHLSVDGHDAGTLDAFWVQRTGQFKVVGVSLSDWAERRINNDVVKQVENQ